LSSSQNWPATKSTSSGRPLKPCESSTCSATAAASRGPQSFLRGFCMLAG
jgi:hypothetical protein